MKQSKDQNHRTFNLIWGWNSTLNHHSYISNIQSTLLVLDLDEPLLLFSKIFWRLLFSWTAKTVRWRQHEVWFQPIEHPHHSACHIYIIILLPRLPMLILWAVSNQQTYNVFLTTTIFIWWEYRKQVHCSPFLANPVTFMRKCSAKQTKQIHWGGCIFIYIFEIN